MNRTAQGILAILAACVIWGLSPLYYNLLTMVPPLELLAQRTLWSFLFFALVLGLQGRFSALIHALGNRGHVITLFAAACAIAVNWYFFIYSVQINRVSEASLGYFIFPLVAVVFGLIVFKEKLSALQWVAVALAVFAVLILTYGLGVAPWLALVLSLSFGTYSVLKKRLDLSPVISVTLEVMLLLPLTVPYLLIQNWPIQDSTDSWQIWFLLMGSGPLTATPLILFSYATRRISMSTVGIMQYINPSIQFLVALLIFAEPMTDWHFGAFSIIWVAVVIYSWSGFSARNAAK
ncbi:EamA-like transporter family protein [Rhodobacteraceae bacterium SB2]|jgi:chloramphenicol-sensitive protein RarD|nr:protein RarD [Marinovum sp.]MBT3650430.1 EamA family transporter RarD [Paracoccaceae bacterium]OAH07223.1 EamA-like transporter family protein [Rhodobacteraceae bacterium SB2]WQC61884.1 EamA family transporter RarD [Alphaproteobacteria bacterium US3C007]MBT4228789.1 EamA family transporter RarD [Paracoccaceae bacterium]|tara:strand:- start:1809 stop:2684 length:876 start_codon:yes stop_codon:yes gene_type:complete